MGVKTSTKKQLFAASGNECSYPGCSEQVADLEKGIVIGEIAHIRAKNPDGPRYDPGLGKQEKDGYANLILLCPNHHTRIDKNPGEYPPEVLDSWKDNHENQVDKKTSLPDHLVSGLNVSEFNSGDALDQWVSEVTDDWESKVENEFGSIENSPYQHGYWIFSYRILGEFDEPNLVELKELLRETKGNETGWPPWCSIEESQPYNGEIEMFVPERAGTSIGKGDYWRATPGGDLFLLRHYNEDDHDDVEPGELFDFIWPVWRVGECLLHSKRLASELAGQESSVSIYIEWEGINERTLANLNPQRGLWGPDSRKAHQNSVSATGTFQVEEIECNFGKVVNELTEPLYHSFDFFELDNDIIETQLDKMRN
jgi:hypothetical protein